MKLNLYGQIRRLLKSSLIIAGLPVLLLPLASVSSAADSGLGNVHFKTSCANNADPDFENAMGLLHHMMYRQADKRFSAGAKRWPECAMFYWGIAMSQFQPVRPGKPSPKEMQRGHRAVDAMNRIDTSSPVERAMADTVSAFYSKDDASYRERISAWADALAKAHKKFPENDELSAFYALSLLATAPRADKEYRQQLQAGLLLEKLNENAPLHPGVYHYVIHAYDNKGLFERALPFAREYGKIAPEVPHALHMPSHIFVRTGDWQEVVSWNDRSAAAARDQSDNNQISSGYAHALDYLIYAQLQLGEFENAEQNLAKINAVDSWQDNFGSAYALAASPARVLLEQNDWSEAAELAVELPQSISWKKFPQTEAMLWFAKGLGAARSGQRQIAISVADEMNRLRDKLLEDKQDYWAKLLESQILTVKAWIALDEGNHDDAVDRQTEAAALEDDIGKSPVTPGHVLPARELLGDMHTVLGNTEEASLAYDNVLAVTPKRLRSTLALKRSNK